MRVKLLERIAPAVYWLSWPANYLYVKNSQRCRVLLCAEGKILIVKGFHSSGSWSLPGGGIHEGEQPEYAATRELMEETNIALGIDQLHFMTKLQRHEHRLHFTARYYIVNLQQVIPATPQLPEILRAEWVLESDLSKYKLGADIKAALSARAAMLQ